MATPISRGAKAILAEEARAADVTVDGEQSAGFAGYVIMGTVVQPITVNTPGSGFEPTKETAPSPPASIEESSANVA